MCVLGTVGDVDLGVVKLLMKAVHEAIRSGKFRFGPIVSRRVARRKVLAFDTTGRRQLGLPAKKGDRRRLGCATIIRAEYGTLQKRFAKYLTTFHIS